MVQKLSVTEAVERRMSVRRFLPMPVPEQTIREILRTASRAPSGGNVQPWSVDVLVGDALAVFKDKIQTKIASGEREPLQYDVYPSKLWEPHRSYRFKCGEDMYALLGVERDDKLGRMTQFLENFKFFGAPVGLFFSLHERFGPPQWSDLGMFMQTIMLLASERGLDSCAQECWHQFPESIKAFCGLDDEAVVFAGMALGYRDEDHPVNRLRTDRADIDDFARFHGFDERLSK